MEMAANRGDVCVEERRRMLLRPYAPPAFFKAVAATDASSVAPQWRVQLANLPTPIEQLHLPELPEDTSVLIKRDDQTGGIELMGNKVRKLEFLLADAIASGCDGVLTAGGSQSNHARATAAACRRLMRMPVHLLLRHDSDTQNGNRFLDTMLGASIEERTPGEWAAMKAEHPANWLEREAAVIAERVGQRLYTVPVGGSNALGVWGYLNAVEELAAQFAAGPGGGRGGIADAVSDVVVTASSCGTLAGLALGLHQLQQCASDSHDAARRINLHAFSVSDTPDFMYDATDALMAGVVTNAPPARSLCRVVCAKGLGYALSQQHELQFISRVARESGLVTDWCYTGKALLGMWEALKTGAMRPSQQVLFVHTGGAPSVFDRASLLLQAAA